MSDSSDGAQLSISSLMKDSNGDILTSPMTGWMAWSAAGVGVLLAIQYAETPEEIEGGGKLVQLVLTAQQAVDLAEELTKLRQWPT
jgi:secreted protein with Ig-like and vWFA domain